MVGTIRPQIVLFGSSIVQYSYSSGGWGAILADIYCRKSILLGKPQVDLVELPALIKLHFPKESKFHMM